MSNDASTVSVQDGKATVKHMVYGGLAIGEERIATPYAVLTISSGTFDAAQPDASRTGETHTVEWQAPAVAITRTATRARQSNSVDLDKARPVVSVGRGIGSKENIALAEQLCKAIGAELACSRPVAENEKWMEHERYVGISNLMLKPELYPAVGISGQIQHMVGANASQTIFAINKDKKCADLPVRGLRHCWRRREDPSGADRSFSALIHSGRAAFLVLPLTGSSYVRRYL